MVNLTVAAVAPTCESNGIKAHYKCLECEKIFSDSFGMLEITSADIVDPALGHDWGDWEETTSPTVDNEGVKIRT